MKRTLPQLLFVAATLVTSAACEVDPCDGENAYIGTYFVRNNGDLEGLQGIRCITGSLVVGEMDHDPEDTGSGIQGELQLSFGVNSLDGAEDLEVVEGDLHIAGNSLLGDLDGLRNLYAVGREVRFQKYPRGDLIIHQNFPLSNLDGLESLVLVGSNLIISANPFLTDIDGMRSLEKVGWEFKVIDNEALDTADVQDFSKGISAVGGPVIKGNGGAGGGS